ncbi:MAG: glycoside hydrolase family 5 protein [Lachnospiraceae bacterium]|nr:glycoside hydrolase family 5 protein [Lachnospiraceae bacterium]
MTTCATIRNNTATPFGLHGKLHVQGTHLVDEHNDPCQLRGLSTHNLSNYPEYVNESALTQMVDEWKISVFRLAMYSGDADGFQGYATGDDAHREELESLLQKAAEITAKLGIYLIIDWHCLLDPDPNTYSDMAVHFFQKMCPVLKDYDHIIYEICNEPNGDTTWKDICRYADTVIPVIKAIDDSKVIVVGTPKWSQRVDEAAAAPLSYDNLLYTLHFYADTHKENLRRVMEKAIEDGLPIFVTEFGICAADGAGVINLEETKLWLQTLNRHGISYIMWNLSNKNETSAIISPTCSKTSGFTEEELSPTGKEFLKLMVNTL